ncbi:hypothetical protein FBULB1_9369 [Fusarium bulbicola]|nr:hypothetical protein FBULB1_9369 [Fusarium bulbicola]
MARAHPRVMVEDHIPYRVAKKQPTGYNAPDTAVQHPNLLNSCEAAGHVPRQLQFPNHGIETLRPEELAASNGPDESTLHPEARNRRGEPDLQHLQKTV